MRYHQAVSRHQAGDTIVEVLIAIVVIATVLTGGFIVSQASLKDVRDSQEHSEALNLLQGQIEELRTAADRAGALNAYKVAGGQKFCMDVGGDGTVSPVAYTTANCEGKGNGGLYKLSLASQGQNVATGNYTYLGTAVWDSVNGGQDNIQIYYRLAVE